MANLGLHAGQRIRLKLYGSPFRYMGTVEAYGSRRNFLRVHVQSYDGGPPLERPFKAPVGRVIAAEPV